MKIDVPQNKFENWTYLFVSAEECIIFNAYFIKFYQSESYIGK